MHSCMNVFIRHHHRYFQTCSLIPCSSFGWKKLLSLLFTVKTLPSFRKAALLQGKGPSTPLRWFSAQPYEWGSWLFPEGSVGSKIKQKPTSNCLTSSLSSLGWELQHLSSSLKGSCMTKVEHHFLVFKTRPTSRGLPKRTNCLCFLQTKNPESHLKVPGLLWMGASTSAGPWVGPASGGPSSKTRVHIPTAKAG